MSSPLQGGSMRRRGRRGRRPKRYVPPERRNRRRRGPGRLLIVLLMIVVIAGGAAYAAFGRGHSDGNGSSAAASGPGDGVTAATSPSKPETNVPPGISLVGPNAFKVRFKGGKPRAALVFDMKNGRVLYRLHPTAKLPIASLTKIMTALIVVDKTTAKDKTRVAKAAFDYSGSGVGVLPKRKKVPVEGLLAGLLLPSGNDAAIALADHISGTEKKFVKVMNRRARALHLTCTRYVSSHGLEKGNRSCAVDLAAMARLAMKQRRIAGIVKHKQLAVRFPIKHGKLYLNSTNPLLRLNYKGTIGLKTGSTDEAGHCLVAVVRRGNRELGVVLLHSPDTGTQAEQLFNAAFKAART
jgi:serine-type D-Ala-D-Ala carboxypeptidase (penicillin-binding protein 5/6)